ncbi:MAG: hypothetical protein IPP27_11430 [Bacteroidetes bacterium]|nr:hypothetical protein [Bacteroidota bacterium]
MKRVTISLFAGSPTATVSQDNPVQFSNTRELVIDQSTNVLYTCEDNKIRKINPDGLTASTFEVPLGFTLNNLGINAGGELFTCWQHAIFKLPIALQSISPILVAGDVSSSGHVDGLSNSAKFYAPLGIISDQENNLYVCDPDGSSNAFIRKITPQGMVSTIAGQAAVGYLDGLADLALFQYPSKLAMDETKNIYISDIYYIRKLLNSGTVGTVVGNGVSGSVNSPFPVQVSIPDQLVYGDGYLYFIDAFKHSIRQIDISTGKTINFMGSSDDPGYVESQDPQQVRFNNPLGLAYDNNRNILFVLDSGNHCIRKIQFE